MRVKLAIGLTEAGRTVIGRKRLIDALSQRGMEHTGGGLVTLSFVATPEAVKALFGSAMDPDTPSPRSSASVGASGPQTEPDITIPEELSDLIEFVSIPPPVQIF